MIARSLFSVLPVLGAGLLVSACTMNDSYPEADYYSARTQARLYALDGKRFEVVLGKLLEHMYRYHYHHHHHY